MKKVFLVLFIIFAMNSEINFRPANAQNTGSSRGVQMKDFYSDGMHYKIFYSGDGVTVVNLTKDDLEVQLLKKQLR